MENESLKFKELFVKKQQCLIFLLVICLAGITVPLCVSIFLLEKTTPLISIFGILTALAPTICAFFSLMIYIEALSIADSTKRKKRDNQGNYSMYLGGLLSIVLLAIYIRFTGGIKGHLMAFCFFYIPSACAVGFKTKWGLIIVSIASAICLSILYFFYYDLDSTDEFHRLVYLAYTIWRIFLIILLELLTNRVNNSFSNKQYVS